MEIISRAEALSRGLIRFFTGRPCIRGHLSERNVVNRSCIACEVEGHRARRSRDVEAHLQRHRQAHRRWYATHRLMECERSRNDKQRIRNEHPELAREQDRLHRHRRRASKLSSASAFTIDDWRSLRAASTRCHWCKKPFTRMRRATHDHVVPLSKGGGNTLENSCCACVTCNSRKGSNLINPVTGQGILL